MTSMPGSQPTQDRAEPGEPERIEFTVPLLPVAKGRAKVATRGKFASMYTPAKTVQAEREFVSFANDHAPATPLDAPVRLEVVFTLPMPGGPAWKQQAMGAGLIWPEKTPDLDNLVKLVQDALNRSGRFWRDDKHVCEIAARKVYGPAPGTMVRLTVLGHVTSRAEMNARGAA